ncbi:MAG TPA: hypothetical protein VE544_04420 [Nitrososphaeraceae archaeon]|nr:hypothetical protein [Nitrososphaeraceae archaeon]
MVKIISTVAFFERTFSSAIVRQTVIFYRMTARVAKGSLDLIARYWISPRLSKCEVFDV